MKTPIDTQKESDRVANSDDPTRGVLPLIPIEEKFRIGLLELIGMCMEAGLHPYRMAEIMDKELKTMREDTARVDREGAESGGKPRGG